MLANVLECPIGRGGMVGHTTPRDFNDRMPPDSDCQSLVLLKMFQRSELKVAGKLCSSCAGSESPGGGCGESEVLLQPFDHGKERERNICAVNNSRHSWSLTLSIAIEEVSS